MNKQKVFAPVSLRIYSPVQILLLSTLAYLILLATSPISVANVGSVRSIGVFIGFYFCLLIGMLFGSKRVKSKTVTISINLTRLTRLKWLLVGVGGIGLALRVFERVYLRAGGVITTDFVENRDLILQSGSGPLAMMAGLIAPLLFFVPVCVFMLRQAGKRRKSDYLLLFMSAGYALFDLIYFGSRSTLLIYVSMTMVAHGLASSRRVSWRSFLYMLLGAIAIVWLFGLIYWTRTSQAGMDPVRALYTSAPSYMITINESVLSLIASKGNAGLNGLLYGYSSACQYLLLGLAEFLNLVDTYSRNHTFGLQLFYIPAKVIWTITGQAGTIEEFIASSLERVGVYTTAFGPIFYDFGILGGMLATLVLGWLGGRVARKLRMGATNLAMPYVLITAVLPFTLVVSLITGGTGQCLLIDAILLAFLMKRRRFRLDV